MICGSMTTNTDLMMNSHIGEHPSLDKECVNHGKGFSIRGEKKKIKKKGRGEKAQ